MSIHTCKVYKILNRVQENEHVMICFDSYPKKKKKKKIQKAKESHLGIYIYSLKKLVIRVDPYLKNQ